MPEDQVKQNPDESFTSKYQKVFLPVIDKNYYVCVNDKFSEPFQTDLGEDAMYDFINNRIEENKFCSDVMKKHFNKELLLTKEDNKISNNSTKCSICDNNFINNVVIVRYYCHITGKYRGSAHSVGHVDHKLNHKTPVAFHNLKSYGAHLIM